MRPTAVSQALRHLVVEEQQPVFIWGSPGTGKSSVVDQLATELGNRVTRHPSAVCSIRWTCGGCPSSGKDGRSQWATPDFLPQDGEGILFLDELNAAPAMVQASCYQLVLDRRLGEYTLPEGWAIVAAGNRDSERAATTKMPTPLRNRFVHIDFEVDVQEWSEWAITANVRPEVIAFIRFRPELLSAFDRDANAFPSPRSWEFVSRILNSRPDSSVEHELIAGAVGPAPPLNFRRFSECSENCPTLTPFC